MERFTIDAALGSPHYPLVVETGELPFLINAQVDWIHAYAVVKGELTPIPLQIDRRDASGRFIVPQSQKQRRAERKARIDANDELVVMVDDLGRRYTGAFNRAGALFEVQVRDAHSDKVRWLYLRSVQAGGAIRAKQDYVHYDAEQDRISGDGYVIGFSEQTPFLVDELYRPQGRKLGPDLIDTMKLMHAGKFLHQFDFIRTHEDYSSRVSGYRDGPVRVIRRTRNTVRMFLMLRTPAIEVDMVAYRSAFLLDTRIDMPFAVGTFFSDVQTRFSVDFQDNDAVRGAQLLAGEHSGVIDGRMSREESELNSGAEPHMVLQAPSGDILFTLNLPKDLPISHQNFLSDREHLAEGPELVPGQFGHLGFVTHGWEAMDESRHHFGFQIYLTPTQTPQQALATLRQSPAFALGPFEAQSVQLVEAEPF